MANIKGKLRQTTKLKGKAGSTNEIVAQTVKLSSGNIRLGDLQDVNSSGQTDGAMLIYDASAGQYKVTTQLENENLNIIGGTY